MMRNKRSFHTDDYRTLPLSKEYDPISSTSDAVTCSYDTDKYKTEQVVIERKKRNWAHALLPYPLVSWRSIMLVVVLPLLLGGLLARFLPFSVVVASFATSNRDMHITQNQQAAVVQSVQDAQSMTSIADADTFASSELQSAWKKNGMTTLDAAEAIDVATTFTQRYQTIDYRSISTLSAARFILTQAENNRFTATDERNKSSFITQTHKQSLIQVASISGTHIIKLQRHKGNFFTWVSVSYQLQRSNQGHTSVEKDLTQQVMLIAVPFGQPQTAPAMGGIGWLVCNFQQGSTLSTIPRQP